MTTATLNVKNQQAFPIHADRMHHHTRTTLHARLLGVLPVEMVPLSRLTSAWLLLQAKFRRLTARVPPLLE